MVGASPKYWDAMHWQIRAHANTADVARQVQAGGNDEFGV